MNPLNYTIPVKSGNVVRLCGISTEEYEVAFYDDAGNKINDNEGVEA